MYCVGWAWQLQAGLRRADGHDAQGRGGEGRVLRVQTRWQAIDGAVHDGRSAGMAREEGSVHRHSQHLLLSLPACASSPHARRLRSTGAPTSHARQQLPATPARGQSAFSSSITTPLRPADARAAGKGIPKRGRRLTTQARSTGRRRSWRCLRAPAALSLHAAPAAHQSGHARLHPDAISAAPRSPPPPRSCQPEGRTAIVPCCWALEARDRSLNLYALC